MRIAAFLQGTVIMHRNAQGKTREEIVRQIQEQEESVRDFKSYIPISRAPEKLRWWASQGADVCYLSALTENKQARGDEIVGAKGIEAERLMLDQYDFPQGVIYHREVDETYKDVVERMLPLPDVLIEDDCESIGGESEMTYPSLTDELKKRIRSITIPEFGGIDHLAEDIGHL